MSYKKTGLSLLFSSFILGLHAQHSSNASGGNNASASGSVSYSIGQVFYESNANTTGTSAQGVQQPIELYTLEINSADVEIDIAVFPNPTSNQLIIDLKEVNPANVRFELTDSQGKKLQGMEIQSQEFQIELESYPKATYLLTILQENQPVKSFKIIKN